MIQEIIATPHKLDKKFRDLWHVIGHTPMIEILYEYRGKPGVVYAKCEHYNLTGSIKDRMALHILETAYGSGLIEPGQTIVEATSGNTGISFSAIGKALGHPVSIIMPDWLSKERVDIIKSLGAEVILVNKEEGGFSGSIRLAESLAEKSPHIYLPRQFENACNAAAHAKTTGPEIWNQLASISVRPGAFIAGVGTGGTVMGLQHYFNTVDPTVRVFPLEPAESPTLSTGFKTGSHRIQGISDEFIPSIVQLSELDSVIAVSDGDAILMAQQLATQLGLAVGISSGANLLGAIKVQTAEKIRGAVVTVFPDSNKKYLSTDLVKQEPVRDHYLTPQIRLIDYNPVKRLHAN